MVNDDFLQALGLVEQHPDVRVLHRLPVREWYRELPADLSGIHRGAYLDVETNGKDTDTAEVTELGVTLFTFDENGVIYGVGPRFQAFEQPAHPIPDEVIRINGITNEMVAGHKIDDRELRNFMNDGNVVLTIAHNAEFDRKVVERRWPVIFETRPWACSFKQVDWIARGAIGSKLGNILMTVMGLFYDAHRAGDDTLAGIHVLTHERDEKTALAELLETTRTGVYRVYANNSPFERKGELKTRDYKWTGEKPWKRDFTTLLDAEAELEWLVEHRLAVRPEVKKISARHRYSVREERAAVQITEHRAALPRSADDDGRDPYF